MKRSDRFLGLEDIGCVLNSKFIFFKYSTSMICIYLRTAPTGINKIKTNNT